ncbi:MBL fold metallo-hydrolase [Paenibacillus sp. SYP-B4298]|uniref:MBL fold metallo-hydrolase n=1 Tax=Paenibacillus sp. SYP-B4298 TaxID=2996034 RepID=UPI0022DE3C77|nr:MBL fold metallo-hydrolase [Paenibacillus sp. SYP-B4298]
MRLRQDLYLLASGDLGFSWTHPADCNVYAVDTGAGLVVIDCGTGESIGEIIRNLGEHGYDAAAVGDILLTHLHADHSGGAAALREATGARIHMLDEAAEIFEQGDEAAISLQQARDAGFYDADYEWRACRADQRLRDGDRLHLGDCRFTVFHTPGHSRFDTCFLMERNHYPSVLISGDTVMHGGKISMLSTYDFQLQALAASIERLAGLAPDVLLPGHGQPVLSRAAKHVERASSIFRNLGVPANIG